jgi:5-formyltetrahydrofolate cyclo-ligase
MNSKKQKQHIREVLLARRQNMLEEAWQLKSTQIINRLKRLSEFKRAEMIHCYVSMNERREVNTHSLIKELLESSKKIAAPVTQLKTGALKHIQLNDFDELQPNKWHVLEPVGCKEIAIEKLELVIVPMAGGDHHRNRIGYGKGFYDRFLQNVRCPSVGLLFEQCLVEKLPVEPFDIQLTKIITEERIIL